MANLLLSIYFFQTMLTTYIYDSWRAVLINLLTFQLCRCLRDSFYIWVLSIHHPHSCFFLSPYNNTFTNPAVICDSPRRAAAVCAADSQSCMNLKKPICRHHFLPHLSSPLARIQLSTSPSIREAVAAHICSPWSRLLNTITNWGVCRLCQSLYSIFVQMIA